MRTPNSMARRLMTGRTPGMPWQTGTRLVVRRRAEGRGAAAEHLRARQELRVDLEPDDGLPGGAHRAAARARDGRDLAAGAGGTPAPPRRCRPPGRAWPRRRACAMTWSPIGSPASENAAGHRDRRHAGQRRRDREHVVQVHRDGVVGLLAELEGGRRAPSATRSRRPRRRPDRSPGGSACGRAGPARSRRRSSRPTARRCPA